MEHDKAIAYNSDEKKYEKKKSIFTVCRKT